MSVRSVFVLRTMTASVALAVPFISSAHAQAVGPAEQEAPVVATGGEEEDLADEEEITIVARRDPNAVIGDIPPENRLNSRDIRAYGVSNVAELLDAIAPQTASGRGRDGGRPVVLLNGRRISGFREIRDIPTEAILRTDILPEEVALKYGYRADQRVVNIVLRPRFRSTSALARGQLPTEGGQLGGTADVTRLMIDRNSRTTLNAHAEATTAISEAERDIAFIPSTPDAVDPRDFRTLVGSRRLARVGGTHNRTLFGDVSSTFDGQVEWSEGRSLLGPSLTLPGTPLGRDTNSLSGHLGLAFNGEKKSWRWSLTGNYDVARTTTETDRENTFFFADRSRSLSHNGDLDLVLTGPLATLPAGKANVTLRAGGSTQHLNSEATRAGVLTTSDLSRNRVSSSANIDLPIAKRGGTLSAIGNLSLNANAEVEHLSDFGTLTTLGAGLYWSPVERLNLIASWTREEGPPSLQQLGDPILATPNSRIFDFVLGQTVLAESITGGNPDLLADRRQVLKLGANYKPWSDKDLTLRADFTRTRIDNPIARFPGPTAAIEAAFPERFVRDEEGNLLRVDLRPVNFSKSSQDQLRWGFTFSKPLRTARPSPEVMERLRALRQQQRGSAGAGQQQGRGSGADDGPRERRGEGGFRGGGPGGGGGFGGGRFGGGRQGGRLQLSVFHTWSLKDEVQIRPGLPTLDYLDGEAADGGIRPRHRVEVDTGWYNNGVGIRLSADWQSGGEVTGGLTGPLDFSPLLKVNANAFVNFGERPAWTLKHPWMRGLQLRVGVDNIFNAKQKVRDTAGGVPINYQPDLLDPLGRTVSISIRKLFSPRPVFGGRGGGRQGG